MARFGRIELDEGARFVRIDGDRAEVWTGDPWTGSASGRSVALPEGPLLPAVTPSKILCVGRNYVAHAKEMGNEVPSEPLLFLKPPSALVGHGGVVRLPRQSERVEHEAELGVVIGRTARRVRPADALDHVFGYTCVCDVTARDLQRKDSQWTRAKGFDTFCPCGPWIETAADPRALRIRCTVNGATRQDGSTSRMVFPVAELVAYASEIMTLEAGDLLVTGSPEGTGPMLAGDAVTVEIDGVGVLAFSVAA